MSRAHLIPLALALLAGIIAAFHNVGLPALCVGLVASLLLRTLPRDARAQTLASFALGTLVALPSHDAQSDVHTSRFAATLVEARTLADVRDAVTLRLADGTLASATLPLPLPAIGSRLVLRGKRVVIDGPRNPGEASPRELAAERGIVWRIARPATLASELPDPRDLSLWLPRARDWASARLHSQLGEPDATILAGALWGERGALAPDLRAEFQDTGTVHILVTAGLHIGVVASLAYGLFAALGCGRRSASLATIGIVWLYAAFSGAHLPSLRAATMLSFALLARASGRDAFSWNALAAAAIVVALLRPASVETVSFALSFSCVAAIFAFARPFASAARCCGLPHVASELAGVAFATQVGTWPLTAAAFLVIAPYAPLANALVVPVVGVAMLVGFAELALAPVPFLGVATANIEHSLIGWIATVVRFISGLPHAHVIATPPPLWTLAIYDCALIAAAFALTGRSRISTSGGSSPSLVSEPPTRRSIAFAAAVIAVGSALCLWPPRAISHDLTVTAIDVGQADALLIRTPRGHAFLIDAGGRLERGPELAGASDAEDIGTRIVVPFLIRSGIHKLDAVLLSHPHGDHAGGLPPVLRALDVAAFADSGQSYPGRAYHAALDLAREGRVPLLEPRGGDVWRTDDGVTFRFYGPTYPYITGSRSDINSNSLVFRLEYGRFRMLFMGDAGTETEERLLSSGDDLHADVLKVGHHGSAYGTTASFLGTVGASAAIVSVGRDNLFGHPAPQTLATLANAHVRVYRTDRDGAVAVRSDGSAFEITPYLHAQTALR